MRQCTLCKEFKEITAFNKNSGRKDGLQNVCRDCNKVKSKQYYAANKADHKAKILANKDSYTLRNREYLANYLKNNPCVDCGYDDIRALEFDHLGDKRKGVAGVARSGYSLQSLIDEIAKCEVRCRNCHAIKTYERIGGSWHNQYMPL